MRTKLRNRLHAIDQRWFPVLLEDDTIVGFANCCPTSKQPEDFVSWEESTQDGSLVNLHDPAGKNVYVVTLSTTPGLLRSEAQNMLYGWLIAEFLRGGFERGYWESRIPGFLRWAQAKSGSEDPLNSVPQGELRTMAEQYVLATKVIGGRDRHYDPLLRTFATVGCDFVQVLPDAYQDPQSLNFGVLTVFNNPLPESVRRRLGTTCAFLVSVAAQSERLMRWAL